MKVNNQSHGMRNALRRIRKAVKGKAMMLLAMVMIITATICSTVFAAGVTPVPVDYSPITDALKANLTPTQILTIIGLIISAGIGCVLAWFGARKLMSAIMTAFKKGKLKF